MSEARRERELYLALLDLAELDDVRLFVERALAVAVHLTKAERGWLGLFDPTRGPGGKPRWWTMRGCEPEDVSRVDKALSTGILAEAMRTGSTLRSASARDDPRFAGRESVQRQAIEAVLCAPVGRDPVRGAVYLQGRAGQGPFLPEDVELIEAFAASAARIADRLVAERARGPRGADPTATWREKLDAADLVGRSEAMAKLLEELAWIASSPLDVLLVGPTGCGKSLVAQVLHRSRPGPKGPFLSLNCASVPEGLFEAELFGTVKGAFTGATDRRGYVAESEGGTLFLDELAELPLTQQAKLLTFLQSREYAPVGAPGRRQRAEVRVIAAMNVEPGELVRAKRFREDLYWRLSSVVVRVPPLGARREDVAVLARTFLSRIAPGLSLSPAAELALELAPWPGDVRQLEGVLNAAAHRALARGESRIDKRQLFPDDPSQEGPATLQDATRAFQREYLRQRLEANDWNVSRTARELDVARSYLYTLMEVFELHR